jgi:hypothetical protein
MTNVRTTARKVATRADLFQIAIGTLEEKGWTVDRIARSGKSSVRRITKGKVEKTVSIRTSQDTWIAFPRNSTDDEWVTLADVDYVIAASVDDRHNPHFAHVHMIEGDEMRKRFDRAYAARKKAKFSMPIGRGIWLSLYDKESSTPVSLVGAGAGLDNPAIGRVPLSGDKVEQGPLGVNQHMEPEEDETTDPPLTITEAKRRLALSLGVHEADIKITISS